MVRKEPGPVRGRATGGLGRAPAGSPVTINVGQVVAIMVTTQEETPEGATHWSQASMAKRFGVVQDGYGTALDLEPRGSILFKCSGKRWSG